MGNRRSTPTTALLLLTLFLAFPASAVHFCGAQPGPIPTCPDVALKQIQPPGVVPAAPPEEPVYGRLQQPISNMGVGYLRGSPEESAFQWLDQSLLPLFRASGGQPFAWIARGWWFDVETGRSRPFDRGGLVETHYESLSFLVLERRSDGWLRFRYSAKEGPEGTAWTHECLLGAGALSVRFHSWETRFLSDAISPLYFEARVRHALRAGPSVSSALLRWVPADQDDYHLEPREIRGDWMRVVVVMPTDYCGSTSPSARYEGWVKWRDAKKGPWVWYFTRGC